MFDALVKLAEHQQMAVGMMAAAIAGTATYALREVPRRLIGAAEELFAVSVSIESTDPLFEHLSAWFSRQKAARRATRLMAQREFDYDRDDFRWSLTLGRGWHLLWFRGWPVIVNRQVNDGGGGLAKALGVGKSQTLKLWTPGRSQALVRAILEEAERIYKDDGKVRVFFWNEFGYMLADRREPRAIETVFLPADQKARILADVETFVDAKALYRRRGTPYRRGYLFTGRPGTGKSSLIFALAARLKRDVFVVNLSSVRSDNALMVAFNEVGPSGVLVIEDIDAAKATADRSKAHAPQPLAPVGSSGPPGEPEREGITLSGLLNALDGVAAREGRITFITTNHPEKLDAALLRAGRVDLREEIGLMDREAALEMFQAFFPGAEPLEFDLYIRPRLPLAAADLQNLLQGGQDAWRSLEAPGIHAAA
jgi:hypothetical protein